MSDRCECAICKQDVENDATGDDAPVALRCMHVFHDQCIQRWGDSTAGVGGSIDRIKCPICKKTGFDLMSEEVTVIVLSRRFRTGFEPTRAHACAFLAIEQLVHDVHTLGINHCRATLQCTCARIF